MADVEWLGAAQVVRQFVSRTLTGVTAGAKWTFTVNAKSASYTATGTDTNDTATAGLVAAMQAAVDGELKELTVEVDAVTANQINVTGPADGMPFTLTTAVSGGATFTTVTTVAADGPHNAANVLNYSTGALPSAADRLIFARGTKGPKTGLTALNAIALAEILHTDGFDNASIGLPDINATNGYQEYRPKFLEVDATKITIQTANQNTDQRVRLKSVKVGAVTANLTGSNAAQQQGATPSLSIDLIGLSANSVVSSTNCTFAISRNIGNACTVLTLSAIGSIFVIGPSATISGAIYSKDTFGRILCNFNGLTVDGTNGAVSVELAAACSSGNVVVNGGTLVWMSTGNPSANVRVNTNAVFDTSQATEPIAVTNFLLSAGATVNISTGKVDAGFVTQNVGCEQGEVTVLVPSDWKAAWNPI